MGIVEETANTAQSMKEQANELQQQVQVFKIHKTGEAPSVKREAPRTREAGSVKREASESRTKHASRTTLHAGKPVGAIVQKDQGHHGADDGFEEF
ncbi:MAG: hypothetical protein HP496_17590 [Nitrospira sp.]|nr:hypothetical protein [Nitrospira sp.]